MTKMNRNTPENYFVPLKPFAEKLFMRENVFIFIFWWEFGYKNQGPKGFILDRERSRRRPDRPVLTEALQCHQD